MQIGTLNHSYTNILIIVFLPVRLHLAMGVNRGDCSGELCRVVLLGDARVGKTALVARAVYDKFSEVRAKSAFILQVVCYNLTLKLGPSNLSMQR